ncbi:hypothetical protein D8B26_003953 [Coccidioides posadasii str. Silveira]|uniref:Uncharacterized protein n=2 Tax=Coccidioides posadasii TaxID=199306 RepID=E9D9I2_COCPS|nr:conserved hypothetical protein [Coccidioides posadasii str. Silveira]QVM09290.1 hypothetical protein D8B26_003953 [Coccidioides posadasii str. Silveira]
MSLSPYRPTSTAWCISKPSEQWRLALQEIKILLLKRQYKQCAALSHDLMGSLDENLHTIHRAYLQYYGAASYETLGRAAHNYSSNKLLLLNLAKEGYVACKLSLQNVTKELKKSDSNSGNTNNANIYGNSGHEHNIDEDEDRENEDDLESVSGSLSDATLKRVYAVCYLTEPWRTYARYKCQASGEDMGEFTTKTAENAFTFDLEPPGNDDIEAIEADVESVSELMPPPLRVQKTRSKRPGLSNIPIPDRSLIPLPLFSPSPLSPRRTADSQIPNRTPKPAPLNAISADAVSPDARLKSRTPVPIDSIDLTPNELPRHPLQLHQKPKLQASGRMLNILTSLPTQLNTNISNISGLISEVTQLQCIHKATKSNRLASYWSFTPFREQSNGGVPTNNPLSRTSSGNRNVSNGSETKQERIVRLRSEGWNTVGIRDPKRGWKGSEYYERICEEALGELYGC